MKTPRIHPFSGSPGQSFPGKEPGSRRERALPADTPNYNWKSTHEIENARTVGSGREDGTLRKPTDLILNLLATSSLSLVLLVGAGCKSIGPSTIKRDRMHYSTAVADSWKEQLLLNIVKTRYGDGRACIFGDRVSRRRIQSSDGVTKVKDKTTATVSRL